MSLALVRPVSAVAWELRGAWADGRRVSLSVDGDAARVEGHVGQVAATDTFVVVANRHIPLGRVLAVHRPSRLGDSTVREDERWAGRVRRWAPQDEQLW